MDSSVEMEWVQLKESLCREEASEYTCRILQTNEKGVLRHHID